MSKLNNKQNAWLLGVLESGEWHRGDDLRTRSRLAFGKEITLHPRITDLREEGYRIETKRNGTGNMFRLTGKGDPPVKQQTKAPFVQGYVFCNAADGEDPHNGNICQIVGRDTASEQDQLTYGPLFRVRFGDGVVETAFSSELSPYYPT